MLAVCHSIAAFVIITKPPRGGQFHKLLTAFRWSSTSGANCTNTKEGNTCSYDETVIIMEKAYAQQAENCGIAVALYILTLIVSLHQLWMNSDRGL